MSAEAAKSTDGTPTYTQYVAGVVCGGSVSADNGRAGEPQSGAASRVTAESPAPMNMQTLREEGV